MSRLREILARVQPVAAWLAVVATVFSAGYFFARAEFVREGRIQTLEEQWNTRTEGLGELQERVLALEESRVSVSNNEARVPASPDDTTDGESETDLVPFVHEGSVRCPGGGDWLSRDRNSRSQTVRYETPDRGTLVERDFRVISNNYGSFGELQNIVTSDDRVIGVLLGISCDPPDRPGAPGGWLDVELYGKYKPAELGSN